MKKVMIDENNQVAVKRYQDVNKILCFFSSSSALQSDQDDGSIMS